MPERKVPTIIAEGQLILVIAIIVEKAVSVVRINWDARPALSAPVSVRPRTVHLRRLLHNPGQHEYRIEDLGGKYRVMGPDCPA